tara:strand:+ start:756 stop:1553 length:798 start_codon:yes stop_codon:yes gene_type:complete
MKSLQVLKNEVDTIYDNINGIEDRISNLDSRKKKELNTVLKNNIPAFGKFKIAYKDTSISIYEDDSNYSTLDMYVYDEWISEGRSFNRIDFSTSSKRIEFSKKDDHIKSVNKFEMLAFYANLLNDNKDIILDEFNTVDAKYSKLVSALYELKRPLNKEVREINDIISKLEDEELMLKLMSEDGLTIETKKDDSDLPRFQVKFDQELHQVKSIRGLKKSTSGKSIDLQVSVRRGYGDEKRLEIIDIERVRFDNVKSFIRRNNEVIV